VTSVHARIRGDAAAALRYVIATAILILSQHGLVAFTARYYDAPLSIDGFFWLFPVRQLAVLPDIPQHAALGAFAFCLIISAALVALALRRADRLGRGFALALFTMVPTFQMVAAAALTLLWPRPPAATPVPDAEVARLHSVAHGVVAGMALIVFAVALSGSAMGAYGWGLFVMTPFLVGVTTGFIVNRRQKRGYFETFAAVAGAGMLGTLALLMLALEGFMCIILIAPLAALLAAVGGFFGRWAAMPFQSQSPLYGVAVLPLLFVLDAAMPPEVPITTRADIVIAAPTSAVWESLTVDRQVAAAPGLVGLAGLAYPVASRISGNGVGAHRHGTFSTGTADERITIWEPGRALAFRVVRQPPAMEEMSPYRKLHTPHLIGYFDTDALRYDLIPLGNSQTRVVVHANHILRIDPVFYWEPIARWAIGQNIERVLEDVRRDSEQRFKMSGQDARARATSAHEPPSA